MRRRFRATTASPSSPLAKALFGTVPHPPCSAMSSYRAIALAKALGLLTDTIGVMFWSANISVLVTALPALVPKTLLVVVAGRVLVLEEPFTCFAFWRCHHGFSSLRSA